MVPVPVVTTSAPEPVIILFSAVLLALSFATVIFCAVELNKYSNLPSGIPLAAEATPVIVNALVGPEIRTKVARGGPISSLLPLTAVYSPTGVFNIFPVKLVAFIPVLASFIFINVVTALTN